MQSVCLSAGVLPPASLSCSAPPVLSACHPDFPGSAGACRDVLISVNPEICRQGMRQRRASCSTRVFSSNAEALCVFSCKQKCLLARAFLRRTQEAHASKARRGSILSRRLSERGGSVRIFLQAKMLACKGIFAPHSRSTRVEDAAGQHSVPQTPRMRRLCAYYNLNTHKIQDQPERKSDDRGIVWKSLRKPTESFFRI